MLFLDTFIHILIVYRHFMADTEIVEKYAPNFEAWVQDFTEWQTRIGFDPSWLGDYRFDIKFDWVKIKISTNFIII